MSDRGQINTLLYSGHALRQMFARTITADQVQAVIDGGESIASYPEDRPYPSELLLGFPEGRALHVLLAYNEENRTGYVVTAYVPEPDLWTADFKRRRAR